MATLDTEPHYFEIRDPERLYAELLNPHGRTAVVANIGSCHGWCNPGVDVIDGGSGIDSALSFSVYSENGKGAELTALLDENGSHPPINRCGGRNRLQQI